MAYCHVAMACNISYRYFLIFFYFQFFFRFVLFTWLLVLFFLRGGVSFVFDFSSFPISIFNTQ
jgi:hypothetical protein